MAQRSLYSVAKDYTMRVEDFCNGYFYANTGYEHDLEEVIEDVEKYFKSKLAGSYAKDYLKNTQYGWDQKMNAWHDILEELQYEYESV